MAEVRRFPTVVLFCPEPEGEDTHEMWRIAHSVIKLTRTVKSHDGSLISSDYVFFSTIF